MLAATVLVSVGRASISHSLAAREAQDQLQRRWGEASCRSAVLPYVEPILAGVEHQQHRPMPVYRATVTLGGQQFDLVLSDEQAKVNVNVLLDTGDRGDVAARLRTGLAGTGLPNRVRLRPAVIPEAPSLPATAPSVPGEPPPMPEVTRWVGSFGDLFDDVQPAKLLAPVAGNSAATDFLTCWGSGGLNVLRASESNLKFALGSSVSGADLSRLVRARDRLLQPPSGITGAAGGPQSAPGPIYIAERDRMRGLLAVAHVRAGSATPAIIDQSACHSLWIVTKDGRREWYSLTVRDESDSARPRTFRLLW